MYILDNIDRSILSILDKNARMSITEISHEIGLSKQVVSYRLRRLEKSNVIEEYSTYIDRAKLGFQHHQLYLKTKSLNQKDLELILKNLPNIHWCANSFGKYNLVIYFLVKGQKDCYDTYTSILDSFKDFIYKKEYLVTAKSHYFNQSAITYVGKEKVLVQRPQKTPKLKIRDFIILNSIKTNARLDFSKIAKISGLTPRSAKDRLKYLRKIKIIRGFRARIKYESLGLKHYQVFFQTLDNKKQIIDLLLPKKEVIRLTETIGKWELSSDIILPKDIDINLWLKNTLDQNISKGLRYSKILITGVLPINTSKYHQ